MTASVALLGIPQREEFLSEMNYQTGPEQDHLKYKQMDFTEPKFVKYELGLG